MEPSHDRNRREVVCVPELIRKWGLHFDGYSDLLAFIEQVEGRALSYGIDLELLPRAMAADEQSGQVVPNKPPPRS